MAERLYIGARYVPVFAGEWDGSKSYEPLMYVTYANDTYISNRYIPIGTAITDRAYWTVAANVNGQLTEVQTELATAKGGIESNTAGINGLAARVDALEQASPGEGPAGESVPIGTVQMFAGNSAPGKWLICNGGTVSRSVYSALFGIIGTAYGSGDGSTTFNLPDMSGRVAIGQSTSYPLASKVGGEVKNSTPKGTVTVDGYDGETEGHELAVDEIPAHSHSISGRSVYSGSGNYAALCNRNNQSTTYATNESGGSGTETGVAHSHNLHLNMTARFRGESANINVMQPSLAMNYIIYAGV